MRVAVLTIMALVVFFGTVTMAAVFPPVPDDLNIIAPDPSLPKELADFSGKWEGKGGSRQFFAIVEKIDREKASLLISNGSGWDRGIGEVAQEYGKWKIYIYGRSGRKELSLRGKYLDLVSKEGSVIFTRVL